jgi:hypothetical protein
MRLADSSRPLVLAVLAVAGAFGCSSEQDSGPGPDQSAEVLPYDQSPIVFGSYDPPGTFALTLADGRLEQLNENYSFYPMSLSPSRRRMLQVVRDPDVSRVEIYDVAPSRAPLAAFELPGQFLGWAGEGTVLFATWGAEGVTRVDVAGARSVAIAFPDWVTRESNGPMGQALSPDGRGAAFLVSTIDQPPAPQGVAAIMIVIDTETGALLDRWTVPLDLWPGRVHWAKDGRIAYYSFTQNALLIGARGQASLTPIALPFSPCEARDWVTPHTLELKEAVAVGDHGWCGNSWLLSTDGTNPVRRDGDSPAAISPDGRKILLWADGGGLSIAEPDGSGAEPFSWTSAPHDPVW